MIATGLFLLGLLVGLSFKHPDSFIPFWLPTTVGGAIGGFVVLVLFVLVDMLTAQARREQRERTVRCFDCNKTKAIDQFQYVNLAQPGELDRFALRCSCGSVNNSWNSLQKELALGRKVQAGD